jgi:hypothetical protein
LLSVILEVENPLGDPSELTPILSNLYFPNFEPTQLLAFKVVAGAPSKKLINTIEKHWRTKALKLAKLSCFQNLGLQFI